MLLAILFAPIQLDHRIATVEAIVAELARKSGRKIEVKREMADEVLYVDLKPHSPEELMTLIAKAASAEWIEDGGLYLGRSATLRRQQEKADRAALVASFETARKRMLADDDSIPWQDGRGRFDKLLNATRTEPSTRTPAEFWARVARIGSLTPMGRLMSRTLRALSLEELAGIPRGYTERFTLNSTRRQHRLSPKIGIDQYFSERALFAEALRTADDRAKQSLSEYTVSYRRDPDGNERVTPYLIVRRNPDGDVTLVFSLINPKGENLEYSFFSLAADLNANASALPGYAQWSGKPLKVGPEAASFVASMSSGQIDPGVARRLREPVKNEPLAILMTDPMDVLKSAIGVPEAIVALPDETARHAGMQLQVDPKIGEFANGLALDVASEVTDGLWLGHARRPSEAVATKTSRTALQNFFRGSFRPLPNLDQTANYAAAQNPEAGITNFEWMCGAAAGIDMGVGPLSALSELQMGGRDLLRVYGNLSSNQRSALIQGESIPVTRITPAGRSILETLLFRRDTRLRTMEGVSRLGRVNDLDASFLVDNLPNQAAISLKSLQSELCATYSQKGLLRLMDIRGLGYVHEAQERDGSFNEADGYPNVAQTLFAPARRQTFGFRLAVTPDYEFQGFLADLQQDSSARAVPYRQLPADYVKEFQKTYDSYRRSHKDGG